MKSNQINLFGDDISIAKEVRLTKRNLDFSNDLKDFKISDQMINDIELFKNHELKADKIFEIREIDKVTAYNFVRKYHYLGDAKFFSVYDFGLFYTKTNQLIGCADFSLPQGTMALKSWFSLSNDVKNIFELSRLCVLPILNGTNATSYLLSGSIKRFKQMNQINFEHLKRIGWSISDGDWICRAIITLADASRHVGSIYQVCNFKYYGLIERASDFWRDDGLINPRGTPSKWHGVYLPRTRKHRYAYILDQNLNINYSEEKRPSRDERIEKECCGGTGKVYDSRFNEWYTCPICTGKFEKL